MGTRWGGRVDGSRDVARGGGAATTWRGRRQKRGLFIAAASTLGFFPTFPMQIPTSTNQWKLELTLPFSLPTFTEQVKQFLHNYTFLITTKYMNIKIWKSNLQLLTSNQRTLTQTHPKIGRDRKGHRMIHKGWSFGERNDIEEIDLNITSENNFELIHTFYKSKRSIRKS